MDSSNGDGGFSWCNIFSSVLFIFFRPSVSFGDPLLLRRMLHVPGYFPELSCCESRSSHSYRPFLKTCKGQPVVASCLSFLPLLACVATPSWSASRVRPEPETWGGVCGFWKPFLYDGVRLPRSFSRTEVLPVMHFLERGGISQERSRRCCVRSQKQIRGYG